MRFSKAPLIATVMAAAIALLVALPALASHTPSVESSWPDLIGWAGPAETTVGSDHDNAAEPETPGSAKIGDTIRIRVKDASELGILKYRVRDVALMSMGLTAGNGNGVAVVWAKIVTTVSGDQGDGSKGSPVQIEAKVGDRVVFSLHRRAQDSEEDNVGIRFTIVEDPTPPDNGDTGDTGTPSDISLGRIAPPTGELLTDWAPGLNDMRLNIWVQDSSGGTRDTKLGPAYVSNQDDTYRYLVVQAQGLTSGAINISGLPGGKIEKADGNSAYRLKVGRPTSTEDERIAHAHMIEALDGDVISIEAGSAALEVIVDGVAPTISGITPASGTLQSGRRVSVGFTVSDYGSGIRASGGSPLNVMDTGADDIDVVWDETRGGGGKSPHDEILGSRSWDEEDRNHSYSVRYSRATESADWYITAKDRVGNMTRAPSDKADKFSVTIDDAKPRAGSAEAGIGYNAAKGSEVADSSAIRLVFEDGETGEPEQLVSSTIEASDFRVAGNTVVDVIHPNNGDGDADSCDKDMGGNCINTQSRVYLVLETPLADDATPHVEMIGEIEDRAGNDSEDFDDNAEDRIAPTLTIDVAGDVSTSGRALTQDEVTVSVASGERLRSLPMVYLYKLTPHANGAEIGSAMRATDLDNTGANAWQTSFDIGDVGDEGAVAVITVMAEDRKTNTAKAGGGMLTPGETLSEDDIDDLDAAGLLVEFDNSVDAADSDMTMISPAMGDGLVTQSSSPFITLQFTESSEHHLDSYSSVAFNSIMVGGMDVSHLVVSQGSGKFDVALSGLSVGDHELEYEVMDAAGNTQEGSVDFEVEARAAYTIDLTPGWNLVSLPSNPADTSLAGVFGDDHAIDRVLGYIDGEWVSAVRNEESHMWDGTLTDIVAGYGYFVHAAGFTELSTMIPESNPTASLPVVQVVQGWNLLGVVDFEQSSAGTVVTSADDYFESIGWSIAYSFNTTQNRWTRTTPGQEPNADVHAGSGYWVWVTSSGTLVP